MVHLYTPWKRQKTFGLDFLAFSGGIEIDHRIICNFQQIYSSSIFSNLSTLTVAQKAYSF